MEATCTKCLVDWMLMRLEHESSAIYSQCTPHAHQQRGRRARLLDSTVIK